jgi:hypothetical protein
MDQYISIHVKTNFYLKLKHKHISYLWIFDTHNENLLYNATENYLYIIHSVMVFIAREVKPFLCIWTSEGGNSFREYFLNKPGNLFLNFDILLGTSQRTIYIFRIYEYLINIMRICCIMPLRIIYIQFIQLWFLLQGK